MPFTKEQQREALLESHNRFMRELGMSDLEVSEPIVSDVRGIPAVTAHDVRFAERWRGTFKTTNRTIGYVQDGDTVIRGAYRDKHGKIVTRRSRKTATVQRHRIMASDLAPIQADVD